MSRFDQAKRDTFVANVESRMDQASSQLATFSQTVVDVFGNWQQYVALEGDATELEASRVAFASKARALVDARKTNLALALDIIAGGMRDENGDPLTRQDLLDELAAVVIPG